MLRSFLILPLLVQLCVAATPTLHFKHDKVRQNYEVNRLIISIKVMEDLTYTNIQAEFYNPTNRNQEGELVIPLPEGATISGYAIEVNGKMKKASVVEDKKAHKAYEEIKARNVDPGIVQKKENNIFHTRVFPILPKKTKSLSISYVTKSKAVDGSYRFKLPIKLDKIVKSGLIKIESPLGRLNSKRLKISTPGENYSRLTTKGQVELVDIVTPVAASNSVIVQGRSNGSGEVTYYKIKVPESIPTKKLRQAKKMTFLWDCSGLKNTQLLEKQFNLLDEFFKKNPDTEIQLYGFGYELQNLGSFKIKSGDWSALKKAINTIVYDGALDFTSVRSLKEPHRSQATIVFTGESNFNLLRWNKRPQTLYVADLQKHPIKKTVDRICYKRLKPLQNGELINDKDARVLEFICKGDLPHVGLDIAYEGDEKAQFKANFHESDPRYKTRNRIVEITLAQHQLNSLSEQGSPERVITEHAIKHRLVSDYTSMIVLETLSDHVKYQIPPLGKEEFRKYKSRLRINSRSLSKNIGDKQRYHSRDYPWHPYKFNGTIRNIKIWNRSLNRFFVPKQYDQKTQRYINQWEQKAIDNQLGLKESKTKQEFNKRMLALKSLDEQRKKLFYLPSQFPNDKDKTKTIHVSLRGLVKDPKNHQIKAGTDLKEFMQGYDLPLLQLYRNAQRQTLNLSSKEYKKTPLQAGDMIVAIEDNQYLDGGFYQNEIYDMPYLLEDGLEVEDYYPSDPFDMDDPFDSAPSSGGESSSITPAPTPVSAPSVTIKGKAGVVEDVDPIGQKQWDNFSAELEKNAKDPKKSYSAYLKLKSDQTRDAQFFIQAATLLYQNKQATLGRRVLSNIIAGQEGSAVAQKRLLFWLMEFQDYQHALALIKRFDPQLASPELRFIKFTILQATNKLALEDETALLHSLPHSFYADSSPTRHNSKYDIRIIASCESTGIKSFLEIEYDRSKDKKNKELVISNLNNHGLYSDRKDGIEEHTMKDAIPGIYNIKLSNKIIATYRIEIYTHWNTPQQTKKIITLHTDGKGGMKQIHQLDFNLP